MGRSIFSRLHIDIASKGRFIRPFFYALPLLLVPLTVEGESQVFFDFDSFTLSEATSIHSIAGNWSDGVSAGTEAFSKTRISFGMNKGPYQIEYLQRYDQHHRYANETIEFLHETNNQIPLQADSEYRLKLDSKKIYSRGIRVGYQHNLSPRFKSNLFVSLLESDVVLDADLIGEAKSTSANDYDFDFEYSAEYGEDPLFGRPSESIYGSGYTIDLSMSYQASDSWGFEIDWFDLSSRLNYKKTLFTNASATSDIKTYDASGYVIYDPAVTGFEGYRGKTVSFPREVTYRVLKTLPDQSEIEFEYRDFGPLQLSQLAYRFDYKSQTLEWLWLPTIDAIGFGVKSERTRFSLIVDDFDIQKAHVFGLAFSFSVALK